MYYPSDENCTRQRVIFWFCIAAAAIAYFGGLRFLPRPYNIVAGLVAVLLVCAGMCAFAWRMTTRKGGDDAPRPAGLRYTRRFVPAMMLYVVFLAATWLYKHEHPAGLAAVLLALAPSVPILAAIRAMLLYLKEETDEFLRSRMLESWSLATGGALAICTVYGFADTFKVVPHIELWAVFPIWALCLFPAQKLANRGA